MLSNLTISTQAKAYIHTVLTAQTTSDLKTLAQTITNDTQVSTAERTLLLDVIDLQKTNLLDDSNGTGNGNGNSDGADDKDWDKKNYRLCTRCYPNQSQCGAKYGGDTGIVWQLKSVDSNQKSVSCGLIVFYHSYTAKR